MTLFVAPRRPLFEEATDVGSDLAAVCPCHSRNAKPLTSLQTPVIMLQAFGWD